MFERDNQRAVEFLEDLLNTPASQRRKEIKRIASNQQLFDEWLDGFILARQGGGRK